MNQKALEMLIYSGAFDSFGVKRSQLMRVYPKIIDKVSNDRRHQSSGQFSLFDDVLKNDNVNEITYDDIPEFDDQTKLKMEKEEK